MYTHHTVYDEVMQVYGGRGRAGILFLTRAKCIKYPRPILHHSPIAIPNWPGFCDSSLKRQEEWHQLQNVTFIP